eukprot:TRINITY_DN3187_c0_g2_i2.p1 TRINITY_DN3187_c0_g2~~TRINITY_DN3187_c0_g2_i2.p1  ORF type:complete len:104 (-),score=0.47 TRINITY_DN3187_c0_g2_i2:28-339(-)
MKEIFFSTCFLTHNKRNFKFTIFCLQMKHLKMFFSLFIFRIQMNFYTSLYQYDGDFFLNVFFNTQQKKFQVYYFLFINETFENVFFFIYFSNTNEFLYKPLSV